MYKWLIPVLLTLILTYIIIKIYYANLRETSSKLFTRKVKSNILPDFYLFVKFKLVIQIKNSNFIFLAKSFEEQKIIHHANVINLQVSVSYDFHTYFNVSM